MASTSSNTAPTAIVHDLQLSDKQPESDLSQANAPANQLFSLHGQTIVVTGGGRGLGITLALAVAEAGGNVACLDILAEPAAEEWEHLQQVAQKFKLTATYGKCDITNEEDMIRALGEIDSAAKSHHSTFSGIIACAGIQQRTLAKDYSIADFTRMLNVNVTGTFITAKTATNIFIKNNVRPAAIVMIASMSGQIANRGLFCSAYNTSKAAVHQMCRSLAQEFGQYGIRVNTISPGYIRTKMTDALLEAEPHLEKQWMEGALLGRLGAPEDFKAPAVFLLTKGSAWMTGADLRVDGGNCATA